MQNDTSSRPLDVLGRPSGPRRPTKPRLATEPDPVIGAKWIALTKGFFALVDDVDFERFGSLAWTALVTKRTVYAYYRRFVNGKNPTFFLHREIMNAPDGTQVDHRDGNGLDCRRFNLRVCSVQQNHQNIRKSLATCSSIYKGVSWDKNRGKWMAKIKVNMKTCNLGRFQHEDDAARAYDQAAVEMFGEFANLNFPISVRAE